MSTNQPAEVTKLLIGVYETLLRHEQQMLELKISVESAIAAMKVRDAESGAMFDTIRQQTSLQSAGGQTETARAYGAIIARLRGVG